MSSFNLVYHSCGQTSYEILDSFQKDILIRKINNIEPVNFFLVSELFPVITCGPQALSTDILVSKNVLKDRGVTVCSTLRGGRVTYHGPGQLVVYFVVDLKQSSLTVHKMSRLCELSCIKLLENFKISSFFSKEYPGVWVSQGKIASIGLRFKRFVSYYGMSLNLLSCVREQGFSLISPCGLSSDQMVSLEDLGVNDISMGEMGSMWFDIFRKMVIEL